MTNEILKLKPQPVQEFVYRLSNLIAVEEIYFSHLKYKDVDFKELIILIPKSSRLHIMEARPLVSMIINCYPQYSYRLFYASEVQEGITRGSMPFFSICKPENLVYKAPESSFVLLPSLLTADSILDKAGQNFAKEQHKIAGFREGAAFYIKALNYPLATLMLHQVMELSYRSAELIIVGREKISHRIRNHQKFLQPYMPELGRIFDDKNEQDMQLLDLLDKAYHAVRYEECYQIVSQEVAFLTTKANLMQQLVKDLYDIVVHQLKHPANCT